MKRPTRIKSKKAPWKVAAEIGLLAGICLYLVGWSSPKCGFVSSLYAEQVEPTSESAFRAEVRQCLQNLNAERYYLRLQARSQLDEWLQKPEFRTVAAEEIRSMLAQPALSVEVRHVLEGFRVRYPDMFTAGSSPTLPDPAHLQTLVRQLESDSYADRRGAAEQLKTYLDRPESASRILPILQARMAQGDLSADLRRWIEPIWDRAWGAWLASSFSGAELPPARPEDIQRYLDMLVRPGAIDSPQTRQTLREAHRQLRSFLARDDQVGMIREAIERRLHTGDLSEEAQARLVELADLCRPAMVAEFWQQRHHRGIQHLLVGVPSQVPGAPRPSHFDFIDDTTAHCVSGSNLSPGYYPVGVAIPHPHQVDSFFHLVNLPTPRRRMAYDYLVQRDAQVRLAEITQRTCQYYTHRRQPLSEREILVLAQLDKEKVSVFASDFVRTVTDEPLGDQEGQTPAGRTSRHGLLCMLLAQEGTRQAVPGLLQALAENRILPPTPEAPYAWGWIAALSIASRDPWPEVDRWLAEIVPRTEFLRRPGSPPAAAEDLLDEAPFTPSLPVPSNPPAGQNPLHAENDTESDSNSFSHSTPQLGATAAAMLLQRHGQKPASYGLHSTPDPMLEKYKVQGYRFRHPSASKEILQWWKNHQMLRSSAG